VPIVPVALTGTADVLPKGGRWSPAPMQVRIGEPIDPNSTSASELRTSVLALRDNLQPQVVNRYALAA
jgi:1-acyl-sn-glycerol-3-phosphate acyltransferase